MAEYRSGHFAEADAALTAAMNDPGKNSTVSSTSAFYRAMGLFRQGKTDLARKLATEAAAKMKPLPVDEQKPLAGGADHDDLIMWLAYKEANAMIQFDATPAAPCSTTRNESTVTRSASRIPRGLWARCRRGEWLGGVAPSAAPAGTTRPRLGPGLARIIRTHSSSRHLI